MKSWSVCMPMADDSGDAEGISLVGALVEGEGEAEGEAEGRKHVHSQCLEMGNTTTTTTTTNNNNNNNNNKHILGSALAPPSPASRTAHAGMANVCLPVVPITTSSPSGPISAQRMTPSHDQANALRSSAAPVAAEESKPSILPAVMTVDDHHARPAAAGMPPRHHPFPPHHYPHQTQSQPLPQEQQQQQQKHPRTRSPPRTFAHFRVAVQAASAPSSSACRDSHLPPRLATGSDESTRGALLLPPPALFGPWFVLCIASLSVAARRGPSMLAGRSSAPLAISALLLLPLLVAVATKRQDSQSARGRTARSRSRSFPQRWTCTGSSPFLGGLVAVCLTFCVATTTTASPLTVVTTDHNEALFPRNAPQARSLDDVNTAVQHCITQSDQHLCRIGIRTDAAATTLPPDFNPNDVLPIHIPSSYHVLLFFDSIAATTLLTGSDSDGISIVDADESRTRGLFVVEDGGRLFVQQELEFIFSEWHAVVAAHRARTAPQTMHSARRELTTARAPVVQVLAFGDTTCSFQAPPSSDLRCWGRNNYGQLGQGNTTTRGDSPWQMGVNLSAVDLGTGLTPRPNITTATMSYHSCHVLDPPGSVKCFGRNNNGQLGYEDTVDRGDDPGELGDALPAVDLGSSLPPILQLAQGGVHNCILFAQTFRVKCWGYNFFGQLGYEDQTHRGDHGGEMGDPLPFVDLGAGLGVVELIPGWDHTCAHLNDTRQGGLKCWGWNTHGQLGYGDTSTRGDGVAEMGDALPLVNLSSSGHVHVVQGDGGTYHACVLLNDSTVKCFGHGGLGQLGYGDIVKRGDAPGEMGDSLPTVDVLGSATGVQVTRVHCGGSHSCALVSDGSLKCWGYGANGQLGQESGNNIGDGVGEMGDALPAIQLGHHTAVLFASLGDQHTCVRLNDSSVKCFGRSNHGQLGQGDTSSRGDNAGEMGSNLAGHLCGFFDSSSVIRNDSVGFIFKLLRCPWEGSGPIMS